VWVTVGSQYSARTVAQHGHVGAVFLAGYQNIRKIFDGYRQAYREHHGKAMPLDRLAYCALVYVGDTQEEARAGADKLLWYLRTSKGAPQFSNPPGYHIPAVSAQFLKPAKAGGAITVDDQMARGNLFAGTPDQVFEQIKTFWEYSGGFGHLLMMGHAGEMAHAESSRSMQRFAREVKPRLQALVEGYDEARMRELRAATPDRQIAEAVGMSRDFVR